MKSDHPTCPGSAPATPGPIRARRMWAMTDPRFHVLNEGEKRLTKRSPGDTAPGYSRVAVLPVDDERPLLTAAGRALFARHQHLNRSKLRWSDLCEDRRQHWYETARVALEAIGVLRS